MAKFVFFTLDMVQLTGLQGKIRLQANDPYFPERFAAALEELPKDGLITVYFGPMMNLEQEKAAMDVVRSAKSNVIVQLVCNDADQAERNRFRLKE